MRVTRFIRCVVSRGINRNEPRVKFSLAQNNDKQYSEKKIRTSFNISFSTMRQLHKKNVGLVKKFVIKIISKISLIIPRSGDLF